MNSNIETILRDSASFLIDHTSQTIDKSLHHLPSPSIINNVWIDSDRNIQTLRNLQMILGHGRLADTGYISILSVDQDIELSLEHHLLQTLSTSTPKI